MMKRPCMLVASVLLVVLIGADNPPATAVKSSGKWTDFTARQLAEHLDLDGGNLALKFETPVYFNIKAVQKKKGEPEKTIADDWTDQPGVLYDLFVKVGRVGDHPDRDDPKLRHRKIRVKYDQTNRTPINEVFAGGSIRGERTDGRGWGFGLNISVATEDGRWRWKSAWASSPTHVELDREVLVYELADADALEETYFRLTMRFSETPPPAKE